MGYNDKKDWFRQPVGGGEPDPGCAGGGTSPLRVWDGNGGQIARATDCGGRERRADCPRYRLWGTGSPARILWEAEYLPPLHFCHFEGACDREIRTHLAEENGFLTAFEMTGEGTDFSLRSK